MFFKPKCPNDFCTGDIVRFGRNKGNNARIITKCASVEFSDQISVARTFHLV
jgi:hypothetical protein